MIIVQKVLVSVKLIETCCKSCQKVAKDAKSCKNCKMIILINKKRTKSCKRLCNVAKSCEMLQGGGGGGGLNVVSKNCVTSVKNVLKMKEFLFLFPFCCLLPRHNKVNINNESALVNDTSKVNEKVMQQQQQLIVAVVVTSHLDIKQ